MIRTLVMFVLLLMLVLVTLTALDAEDLPFTEEMAIRAAVERVVPSVVRIETAGVSEAALAAAAEANPAIGPSTGMVIEEGGWVLATSFAVPADANEAIVLVPGAAADGAVSRRVARVVGRDLARGLVLLKTDGAGLPPVAEWVPRAELAVGEWTIAVGRAWDLAVPSVAVGILSATNRSWGRSVQTDASISPANYGGPLIDIKGRVIGILAPLPADTAGMNLGTELYDSGIGFAVPLADVHEVLPRLKNGETLSPGVIGIGYSSRDPFTGEARVATCRAGSPAAKAGIRAGDLIVSADGRPVTRIAELRHVLAPHYAGDTVRLTLERAAAGTAATTVMDRVEVEVRLVQALPPWKRPFLGIVPARSAARDAKPAPVRVAWVWPGSPAAKAGVLTGDQIDKVMPPTVEGDSAGSGDAVAVASAAALAGLVAGTDLGQKLGLVVSRDGQQRTIPLETVAMPADLPAALLEQIPVLIPQQAGAALPNGDSATVERLEAAEVAKPPLVVLPAVPPQEPVGVLIYLDVPRGDVEESQAAEWKAAVARYGVAVILPGSADPQRWGREDLAGIKRAVATLSARRVIDPARIAVAGRGAGGASAWLVAESLGPAARGVALLDSALPRQATVEPAEPGRSRWVLFGKVGEGKVGEPAESSQLSSRIEADRRRLEDSGTVVGVLPPAPGPRLPTSALLAWVEALGVL